MSTIEAAERVRAALQEQTERESAGKARMAAIERQRAEEEARHTAKGARVRQELEDARAAGQEAFEVARDALQRIASFRGDADKLLSIFGEEHAARRDAAEARLVRVLAGVDAELQEQARAFVAGLADSSERRTPSPVQAIELAGRLLGARERSAETAEVLRGLLDTGSWSGLTSQQFEARRKAAKVHRDAIHTADAEANERAAKVGALLKQINGGDVPSEDITDEAAQILDLADVAERDLQALRDALDTDTTNKE